MCPKHLTGVPRLEMTVRRTSYFSRFSSATRILASSFRRTWVCFASRCRVTLAVVILPCALNLNRRTVSDGDVEEELLSYALRRSLSGMVHGSSRVNSLYRRLCTLDTTSCAAYLPTLHTKSIASVPTQSRHRSCSAERRCWCTWRAAVRRSAVLTTVKIDESKFDRRKYHRGHPVKG